MARPIDADALKTAVDNGWQPDMMVSEIWGIIDEQPTIDELGKRNEPITPNIGVDDVTLRGMSACIVYKCGCCNSVVKYNQKYCGNCGQAVKWDA